MGRRVASTTVASTWAALGVVLVAAGCPSSNPGGSSGLAKQLERQLIKAVPGDAWAAVVIRPGALSVVNQLVAGDAEMKQELATFLVKRAGVDLTEVKGAVAFAIPGKPMPGLAALLQLDDAGQATLKGPSAGEHGGVALRTVTRPREAQGPELVAGVVKHGLVVGTRPAVVAAIDRLAGKGKPLDKQAPLGGLLAADGADVEILAGARVAAGMPPKLVDAVERFGVEDGWFTMSAKRLLTLRLGGNAQRLSVAKRLLTTGLKHRLAALRQQKEAATAGDNVVAGVSAITSYHQMKRWTKELEPKLEGQQLVVRLQLPQDSSYYALAMTGVLAAVAIPAFVKYQRRAKTVEATEVLAKVKAGARAYFAADHYDKLGNLQPKSFPAGETGWVPARRCCEQPSGKCQPDPAAWAAPPWRQLRLALAEPHRYQYRYRASGQNTSAEFVIEARGDLDCDGIFSSYKLSGRAGPAGTVVTQGPRITNEIE